MKIIYGIAALFAAWCAVGLMLLVSAAMASPDQNSRWKYKDS